jgi:hypothetical protein
MPEILSSLSAFQWLGIAFVALFLVKRVFKWALVLGVVLFVAAPYLTEIPAVAELLTQLGL